jgi:hypothetical protein
MAELDTEWMKFMSRLSRQQNCDNADDGSSEDDDDDDSPTDINPSLITHGSSAAVTLVVQQQQKQQGQPKSEPAAASIKKSCISKKAQRRTYSFLDASTDVTAATPTAADPPSVSSVSASASASAIREFHSNISPIYISTKTKIAYLNKPVNIYDAFWKVPVQHYYERKDGVIKKQIKFQTTDPAFIASIKEKLEQQPRYYEEFIIEHIENPTGRIPYKDQRKVSIGICKKDLQGNNPKKKRAFFNCFVLILRINGGIAPPDERAPEDDILYKEMHVKVFNTGKLEIPGIQEDATLTQVLRLLVDVLRPQLGDDLNYLPNRCETALINSNFNCGFYIDRDKLFHLLKYKYRMNCNYDSCSYPGIQSKFYYIPDKSQDEQTGQQPVSMETTVYYEVSFMIFRTGSILIVGKCNEDILMVIYRFICSVLTTEYSTIEMGTIPSLALSAAAAGAAAGAGACHTVGGAKGVKNSRKKKINITEIRYYNPDQSSPE